MSGKKSTEQAIQGRRLRPIYDAIDSGQNKKAIQEADKVLKKHPGTLAAKALKALALIRTERSSEAWVLIDGLESDIKAGINDENLLQAVCHCYKEGFVPERIVTLYEFLSKEHPNDEAILSQLFLAYVRVGNYKEQQRIAMLLYKEFNLPPYLMWSIMSIVMQGLQNEKLGSAIFYPLAEKMMQKITQSYTFKGEEVDLYLTVLEARGKLKEAIAHLEKEPSFCDNLVPGTKAFHYLDRLYFLDKDFDTVADRAVKCLEVDYTDWTSWQYFLDAKFELVDAAGAKDASKETIKELVTNIVDVCHRLMEKSNESLDIILRRGPILACLEVISRLRKCVHIPNAELNGFCKLNSALSYMKQLIECSHTKPYCFADVNLYLHLLQPSDFDELIVHTASLSPAIKNGGDTDVSREILAVDKDWNDILREELVLAKISHQKIQLSDEERRKAVSLFFTKLPSAHFQAGQVASAYASLIAGYLLENGGFNTKNSFAMIIILEHIRRSYLDCDKGVFILLCGLYAIFGDVGRVMDLCRQLDIKYIQRDSLGFIQFFLAERFGRFRSSIFFYTSISALYDQSEREVAECCVNAYKNGQFSQISKIADFQRRCVNSIYSTATDVMNRLLSSCFGIDSADVAGETLLGDNAKIDWDNLCDNRDFDVIAGRTCDCCSEEMEVTKKKSFAEMVCALKLQHSLCRTIGILSSKNLSSASFQIELAELESNFESAGKLCDDVKQEKFSLNNFSHLNLSAILRGGYLKVPMLVFQFAKAILESHEKGDGQKKSAVSVDTLPTPETILPVLEAITSQLPKKGEQCSLEEFVDFLEKSSYSLQYLVSSLLALKFIGRIVASGSKNSQKTDENSQKKAMNTQILEHLSKFEQIIVETLKKVRGALSTELATLDEDLGVLTGKTKPEVHTIFVQFPNIDFKSLLPDADNRINNNTNLEETLSGLKLDIEISMKTSYVQSIQESLGGLLRADTKLLGNVTQSFMKWPKLLIEALEKTMI